MSSNMLIIAQGGELRSRELLDGLNRMACGKGRASIAMSVEKEGKLRDTIVYPFANTMRSLTSVFVCLISVAPFRMFPTRFNSPVLPREWFLSHALVWPLSMDDHSNLAQRKETLHAFPPSRTPNG